MEAVDSLANAIAILACYRLSVFVGSVERVDCPIWVLEKRDKIQKLDAEAEPKEQNRLGSSRNQPLVLGRPGEP